MDVSADFETINQTFDYPGIYTIHIAGRLDTCCDGRVGGLEVSYIGNNSQVTILSGSLPDQAALLGVLNTLYNCRFPLLLVRYHQPLRQGK